MRKTKNIYDAFPRISENLLRTSFWPSHVQNLVERGYREITKSTGLPFTVRWWAKDFLILPPEALHALRDADWTHLSFYRTISDAFFLHTSVGNLYDSDRSVQLVRKGLNPRLPQLTSILEKEIQNSLKLELGENPQRKSVAARDFFTAVVHRSASRILIGEELCRDEQFIRESTSFVMSIFITALAIVKLPLGPFRDWLAHPISIWHRHKLTQCTKMLLPVLEKRIEEFNHSKEPREAKLDAIEWLLMLSPPGDIDKHLLATELMHNLWAGTSAPGGLVTEIIFQQLLEPQYKDPLINEAIEALGSDGRWTEKALGRLPLLDSFIREINRLNPTGSITCSRTVIGRPFVFPDGLTLPVGTRFGFPTEAMQNDAEGTFDGFRFVKKGLLAEADDELRAAVASTTVSANNLAFGYGTHACPGRFFAIRLVKMVVLTLLLNYEIEWDGHVSCRPKPTWIEGQYIPNGSQRVKITKRAMPLSEASMDKV
ncbi:cytochrome P450 [Xylaria intraflava]|nr:cytochrome P450 [Xylaria intraflava]